MSARAAARLQGRLPPGCVTVLTVLLLVQAILQSNAARLPGLLSSSIRQPGKDATQVLSPLSEELGNGRSDGLDNVRTVFDGQKASLLFPQLKEAVDPPPFNLEMAQVMARLTSVAYCSDTSVIQSWSCTRCRRIPTFQLGEVVFDTQWDLLGFIGYVPELNAITVVFRGTDSSNWGNWINNLKAWRQNKMYPIPEAPRAMVHAGFYNLWTSSALQHNITAAAAALRAKHPTARLFVTGHSMGGALSALCALDLKFHLNFTEVRSWSFGSPRVGNVVWQQLFNEHVLESWRFTHNRDVVPSLPPQLIGFHHVAREAWLVDVDSPGGLIEQKVLVCDGTGEDPSCHNSACLLGLCTSVADHLTYLGLEMYRDPMEC